MIDLLKIIGIVMATYGAYGITSGRVYSTRDTRMFYRKENPFSYWTVSIGYLVVGCLIYFALTHKYG